jgi:hypothetical protein
MRNPLNVLEKELFTWFLNWNGKTGTPQAPRIPKPPIVSHITYETRPEKIRSLEERIKPKTGRGNISVDIIEKAKELLRAKHPETVRFIDIAKYCHVSGCRAARIVDYLSGNVSNGEYNFLTYVEDEGKNTGRVGIFRDDLTGISPW